MRMNMKPYRLGLAALTAVSLLLASCEMGDPVLPPSLDTADIPAMAETQPPETDAPAETVSLAETDLPTEGVSVTEAVFHPSLSYARDGSLFLRAEHMTLSDPHTQLPSALWVHDLASWQNLMGGASQGDFTDGALSEALAGMDEDFFATHSLVLLVTEGRSGSIRYRIDGVDACDGKLSVALTAEVPPAVTMDIVHWWVVIPVEKDMSELPVEIVSRDDGPSREEMTVTSDPVLKPRDE